MSQAENSGGRACGRRIRATCELAGFSCRLLLAVNAPRLSFVTHNLPLISPDNGKWVEAKVVDLCMGCAPKDIDLSLGAFRQIAHPDLGRIKGQWWYI